MKRPYRAKVPPKEEGVDPVTGKRFEFLERQKAERKAGIVPGATEREQLALLLRAQAAQKARDSFMDFVRFTSPDHETPNDPTKSSYKNARHHDAIARALEEVEAGRIRFLVLTMPPRHGKSELVSRRLPAWFVGRNPGKQVAVATYSDEFARDFGRDVRAIMKSPAYRQVFPETQLLRGGAAADRLATTSRGQLHFVGRGGPLTGRGAHLLILDDLIKDSAEANSQAVRDQAWYWFTRVALARRMGMKLVVMTFTRWHSDDPIGRLTDPENPHYSAALAEKVKIINLPAIAEDDDPLGRAPGEALWPDGPDTFDLDFLEEQRSADPLGFAALYQQRPSVADGTLFRRENIRFYKPRELPETLRWYCASDHAVATGQRNDFTVLLKAGVAQNGDIYLTDCYWQKVASDIAVEAMLAFAGGNSRPLIWWAERGQISKSIGPFLYKRMAETGVYINLVEVTPVADKVTRAQSISARVASGRVLFPEGPPWVERAIAQMMGFPNGTHDDFVDALAYIGLGLQHQIPASTARPRVEPPAYGTLAWVKENDRYAEEQRARRRYGGF